MSTSIDSAAPSWTATIVKGRPFRKVFYINDKPSGVAVAFANLQIDVQPNIGAAFSWTQANGKLKRQDDGSYLLELSSEDTAALAWSSAAYAFNGTEVNGDQNPRFLTGLLLAEG